MIVITGASENHQKSLSQFIRHYLQHYEEDSSMTLVIYNLGLTEDTWKQLQQTFSSSYIQYQVFDYSLYPEYVNIHINAGEYAWKPILLYEMMKLYTHEILLWMDAGNLILQTLDPIIEHIQQHGLYSANSSGTVQTWTHPETISFLHGHEFLDKGCKNASCLGFHTNIAWVRQFLETFQQYALTKSCIAPDGSNRDNHRQDQAVFTILYYQYQQLYQFQDYPYSPEECYLIHQDID
jgi:Protein of unknown function (DUF1647)